MTDQRRSPSNSRLADATRASLGATFGLLAVAAPMNWLRLSDATSVFLIGSFGATAVLLFAAPDSPLGRPYNMFVGHAVSAAVGVGCVRLVQDIDLNGNPINVDVVAAVAVGLAIAAMLATNSLHPPGGATAFIAVKGGADIRGLGFGYIYQPVLIGLALLFLVALVANNVGRSDGKRYPARWR